MVRTTANYLSRLRVSRLRERAWEILRARLLRSVGSRSSFVSSLLRHPNPWRNPTQQKRLDVWRPSGLGDVLMCTPALRELKRVNPQCHIRLHTEFPSLISGLPYIDEAISPVSCPPRAIRLLYEDVIPPRRHIAEIFGDCLGVYVSDIRPDCVVDAELKDSFITSWRNRPRPHIVLNRRAGPWTPNKDWPDDSWQILIGRLQTWATVIEIGSPSSPDIALAGEYIDLRGRTSLEQLVAAVAAADLHIGPISGPVHIAAAVGTPAVVIYGGYEHPVCSGYPGNISLYTRIRCSPCWLSEPCPFGLECLRMISPQTVETAVHQLSERTQANKTLASLVSTELKTK
jgi:Glycosyltransferase family 9 (heptosyltransferase)